MTIHREQLCSLDAVTGNDHAIIRDQYGVGETEPFDEAAIRLIRFFECVRALRA